VPRAVRGRREARYDVNSIYFKNFMATASVVLASFLMLGMAFIFMGRYFVMSDARNNMEANAEEIARAAASLSGGRLDDWDMRMTLSMLSQGTGNHIFLCDEQGYVVSCSDMNLACEHMGRRVPASYREIIRLEGQLRQMTTLADFYQEKRVVVGRAIEDSRGMRGYVFVSRDASDIVDAYGSFVYVFFLTGVAVLSIAMVISLLFSKAMAKHLDEMAIAARKYSHGDFSMRVSTDDRTDEMGALTDSFNAMADALEKSERSRQDFIANVSHELKTPMTTIAGFAEGLLDGTIPREDGDKYLAVIADETRRLSRLVREMLDMSRMQEGYADPKNMTDFNLNETVITTLLSFETRAEGKQLEVDLQLPEDTLTVRGNEDAIHRVLYNLLDNAIKFAAPGSTLTVAIWKQAGKACVSVADRGETIPPEDLPMIFDRFHKSDRSRSLDRDGVGLGLYLVKSILDAHDEDIAVTSRDGVTKFVFTLKLSPQKTKGEARRSAETRK
jgi:signal transduction histidine kinase